MVGREEGERLLGAQVGEEQGGRCLGTRGDSEAPRGNAGVRWEVIARSYPLNPWALGTGWPWSQCRPCPRATRLGPLQGTRADLASASSGALSTPHWATLPLPKALKSHWKSQAILITRTINRHTFLHIYAPCLLGSVGTLGEVPIYSGRSSSLNTNAGKKGTERGRPQPSWRPVFSEVLKAGMGINWKR